jgi:hypothetical protein
VPTPKRRSRIASFRISDEEYESFKAVSSERGARNVSEYIRSVALQTDGASQQDSSMLESLSDAVAALDRSIRRLNAITDKLEKKPGSSSGEES